MKPDPAESGPLPHLETFARAAELGSFTAAARALRLTQAAVSQRVRGLEQALGTSLFRRTGGRVLLTDAGRRLYDFAQQIERLHRQARQEVTGREAPVAGELSLAASSVPGEHLLPAVLSAFRRKHPHVQVRATVTDSAEVLEQVQRGDAQVGLVGRRADLPGLEFRSFACDELVVVVPPGHPWRRRKEVTVTQLRRQPLVLREAGSGSRWCLEQALAGAGVSLAGLEVVLELGSNEAIKEAVLQGLGLAVLSRHAVGRELREGRLHAVPVADLPLKRDMFAVWSLHRALPIPARLFLAHLLDPCPQRPVP